jgi:DNA-binding CsgD family transcriptional regulator/tetratricopeptide (TPR) repeat protein
MELLEREPQLGRLEVLLAAAASGEGTMVLVGGEAGAGKTSLVQRFAEHVGRQSRVMIGACDAMSAPRPLGPLFDVAPKLGQPVPRLLREPERRNDLFGAVLDALSTRGEPIVLVIEDVHWADDATIDLLRYLGRRVDSTRALIVVTYRDDEVSGTHPFRTVLGDLATSLSVHRMKIDLLSPDAVGRLAEGTGIDLVDLYARTDGNPFYVTEVLATGEHSVPPTIRDAVMARVARLSEHGRAALDAAAVIGGRIEPWLLSQVCSDYAEAIDESLAVGLVVAREDYLQFRHQLGQEAVYEALSLTRRAALHAAVLDTLRRRISTVADYARLAHHAEAAGDAESVLAYAPQAAMRASAMGAHHDAANQYERALRYADGLPEMERDDLLAKWLEEGLATGLFRDCTKALNQLIASARKRGDAEDQAKWLAWLAFALVHDGHKTESDAAIGQAIALLESLPPSLVHAHVYQLQARLRMLNRDYELSISFGERAIELAEKFGNPRILVGALNAVGSSRVIGIDEVRGRADLEQGLAIAQQHGLDTDIASLLTNLGSSHGEVYRFEIADRYLSEGIAFTRERDLDGWYWYLVAWLALVRLYQGKWDESAELATSVVRTPAADSISLIMAQIALGRVRARRGDPEIWPLLDEALERSVQADTLQRLAPTHAARAEAAWLAGKRDMALAEARAVFDLAERYKHSWHLGELGYWRWKCGDLASPPPGAALPWERQISGDWEGASRAWSDLACPYESARALAESNDEDALRSAFATFDKLGARPASAMVIQRLREIGAASIPRGTRPSTRINPAMLTSRELEVLRLLHADLTNNQIADQLYLSPKTVEHHVSSILAKLGVSSRRDAVRKSSLPPNTNFGDR